MYVPFRQRPARSRRSNHFTPPIAVLSGALQSLSDLVLQPVIFLPAVAFLLGASSYQVAGFAIASFVAWAWAGAIVSPLRTLLRRDYHLIVASGVARLLATIAIGFIGYRLRDGTPGNEVRNLLIAYAVYQVAAAVNGRAAANSISVAALARSQRGLSQNRAFAGVVVAVIGGAAAWSTLGSNGTASENAGIMLVLATTATAAGTWFLLAIPGSRRAGLSRASRTLSASPGWATIRSRAFRRYLFFRSLLAVSAATDPFLIVFGLSRLGLTLADVGVAMAVYAVGHLAGMLLWPRWLFARSAKGPLQATSLIRLTTLVIAVSIPSISTSDLYTDRFDGPDLAIMCFISIFGLLGLVVSANNVANQPYLLDIFPTGLSYSGIALTNTVLGALAFGPLGAAYVVNRFSMEWLLYGAIAVAFAALMTSGLLVESRVKVRHRFGSPSVARTISQSAA